MRTAFASTDQIPQNTQFIVFLDDSFSCMGDNYGPPDPPPRMETHNTVRLIAFDTEESLTSWIKSNSESYSKKSFKILPYKPLTLSTEVKISLS